MQVLKVDPADLREACQAMCLTSGATQSCQSIDMSAGKPFCNGRPVKYVW